MRHFKHPETEFGVGAYIRNLTYDFIIKEIVHCDSSLHPTKGEDMNCKLCIKRLAYVSAYSGKSYCSKWDWRGLGRSNYSLRQTN